ncbi:alkaline phosphatase family protein [Flavobacteriaceae bacterium F89]|uniref:Alkaline phosphatase family protein n=1 Tax=Cerina litoralis TaxID=2874477 RepID=A0AAE3EZK9_9FLAO|nr:alkaline phosphatase family protein [Cerina litoralis]MCG2462656.1 alkaline phosphatase family protein [Cerina litoralis]
MQKNALIFLASLMVCIGCKKEYPKPDHIVIVLEENHGFDQIIGSPHTPFINSLIEKGALFTDSHGVTHPSQPNYLALFSGSTQGVEDDHCLDKESPYTTTNLGAALINSGYTFTGYAQNMPEVGYTGCSHIKSDLTGGMLYARKHCPWVNWQGGGENNFPATVGQPMTEFPSDFSKLPTVSFVIPDQDHDMHNNGGDTTMIRKADDWLRTNLSAYIEWAKSHNSLFILTYDEDNFTKQNEIPTIFTGEMVKSGRYNDSINHYNVLRSIEKMYDLPKSGPADAGIIANVWK